VSDALCCLVWCILGEEGVPGTHVVSRGVPLVLQGAVENILERSDRLMTASGAVVKLDAAAKALVLQSLGQDGLRALRCLALAYTDKLGALGWRTMGRSTGGMRSSSTRPSTPPSRAGSCSVATGWP